MGLYTHNYVANGNLQVWDSGPVPDQMDAQVTNTTITRLQRSFPEERPERRAWTEIAGERSPGGDRFIYQGSDALRATLTSSASADDFRLHPEGASATAWTGTAVEQVPVTAGHTYRLAVAARCNTDGNLLTLRIVLRDNTDAVLLHLQSDGTWGSTSTGTDLGLGPRWGVVGVSFRVPLGDSNTVGENVIWQVSNGTSGSQIIDIGELRIEDLTLGYSSR